MPLSPEMIVGYVIFACSIALALSALFGAIEVSMTREDAFTAADRQPKWIWCGILAASAAVIGLHLPVLNWIGIVATGVYFFDVRPQVKDIINGTYRW